MARIVAFSMLMPPPPRSESESAIKRQRATIG